jgi:hypothetical protein
LEDLIRVLKKFSADIIEKQNLTPPVHIELTDVGINPMYEMDAHKNDEGTYVFSNERFIAGTLSRPTPYRVRFTVAGKQPFVVDFPQG